MVDLTRETIVSSLLGRYGCRRFIRDGYKTAIEVRMKFFLRQLTRPFIQDPNRLYYNNAELQQFEDVECEWPLFLCYLMLDALFCKNKDMVSGVDECRRRLNRWFRWTNIGTDWSKCCWCVAAAVTCPNCTSSRRRASPPKSWPGVVRIECRRARRRTCGRSRCTYSARSSTKAFCRPPNSIRSVVGCPSMKNALRARCKVWACALK